MWFMVGHLFVPQLKCADPEIICLLGFHLNVALPFLIAADFSGAYLEVPIVPAQNRNFQPWNLKK